MLIFRRSFRKELAVWEAKMINDGNTDVVPIRAEPKVPRSKDEPKSPRSKAEPKPKATKSKQELECPYYANSDESQQPKPHTAPQRTHSIVTNSPQKKTKSIESNTTKPNIEQITLKSVKSPPLISDRKIAKTESKLELGKTEIIRKAGHEKGILGGRSGKDSRVTKETSTRTVRNDRDTGEKEKETITTTTATISEKMRNDSSTNESPKPDDGKGLMGKLKNMFKF